MAQPLRRTAEAGVYPLGKRGITLVEIMFSMSVFALVLATALAVFGLSMRNYQQDMARNVANGEVQTGAQYIERDLRNSYAVLASYGSYTTGAHSIVVSAPSYNSSGVIDSTFDTIAYKVDSSNALVRTTAASAPSLRKSETSRLLARGVTSLNLTYKVHDFFTGNGTTSTFTLNAPWSSTPTCRLNGTVTAVSYNAANHTASFTSPPASGAQIEFAYLIDPTVSSNLPFVSEVSVQIQATSTDNVASSQVVSSARLRK